MKIHFTVRAQTACTFNLPEVIHQISSPINLCLEFHNARLISAETPDYSAVVYRDSDGDDLTFPPDKISPLDYKDLATSMGFDFYSWREHTVPFAFPGYNLSSQFDLKSDSVDIAICGFSSSSEWHWAAAEILVGSVPSEIKFLHLVWRFIDPPNEDQNLFCPDYFIALEIENLRIED